MYSIHVFNSDSVKVKYASQVTISKTHFWVLVFTAVAVVRASTPLLELIWVHLWSYLNKILFMNQWICTIWNKNQLWHWVLVLSAKSLTNVKFIKLTKEIDTAKLNVSQIRTDFISWGAFINAAKNCTTVLESFLSLPNALPCLSHTHIYTHAAFVCV